MGKKQTTDNGFEQFARISNVIINNSRNGLLVQDLVHKLCDRDRNSFDRVLRHGLCELQGRPQKSEWILFQLQEWSAKKQTCVGTSTTEAEVHALSEAVKEALHLQWILDCIGETKRTTILSDSQ